MVKVRIQRQLGLLNAVSITTGTIIGSGIFLSPKGVLENIGAVGPAFLIWLLCGFVALFSNLSYVELALAMPRFGGEYAYLREIYGDFVAFVYQWLSLMVMVPASNAACALVSAEYILKPILKDCPVPSICLQLVAVLMLSFVTYLTVQSVQGSNTVVNCFMFAKFLALALIIFTGIGHFFVYDKVVSFDDSFNNVNLKGLGLAYFAAYWSFVGGDSIMSMTEEFKNPRRDFPRSAFISYSLVITVYLLANVAYLVVLSPEELLNSNAVAVHFSDRTLGVFAWFIPMCVALSTFGSIACGFVSITRSYYASARDGLMPMSLALVTIKQNTPIGSIVLSGVVCMAYLLVDDIWFLVTYFNFATALCECMVISTIFVMRWRRPDIQRPFQVPIIFPILVTITRITAMTMSAISAPINAFLGCVMTATAVPVYFFTIHPRTKFAIVGRFSRTVTIFLQKLTFSSPEDKAVKYEELNRVNNRIKEK